MKSKIKNLLLQYKYFLEHHFNVYLLIYFGLAVVMMFLPLYSIFIPAHQELHGYIPDKRFIYSLFNLLSGYTEWLSRNWGETYHLYSLRLFLRYFIVVILPIIIVISLFFIKFRKKIKLTILIFIFIFYIAYYFYFFIIINNDFICYPLFAFYFSIFLTIWGIFSLIVYKTVDSLPLKPPRPRKLTKLERIAALEEEVKRLNSIG